MKPKFNATDYIRVDSRTMHGQEKLGEAVSAGQLIIQLSNSLLARLFRIINIVIIIIVVVLTFLPLKNHFLSMVFQTNKQTNKNMTFDHNL